MTTTASPHVGDVGTLISIQLLDGRNPVDLGAATGLIMIFRKPDRTCLQQVATLATDGSDGTCQCVMEEGMLDQSGTWGVQARVTLDTGEWHSDAIAFTVTSNLCRHLDQSGS